ncbi:MAG TPA: hypothetical protein VHR86_08835 [Armatimonadota bacterium]|nr:hypothetical protein [Armatimonadota bacterium]
MIDDHSTNLPDFLDPAELHRANWRHAVLQYSELPLPIKARFPFTAVLRRAGLPPYPDYRLSYRRRWHGRMEFFWEPPLCPALVPPPGPRSQSGAVLIEFALIQPIFLLLALGGLTLMMAVVSREAVNASSFACALAMAGGNGQQFAEEVAKKNIDSLAISILPMGQPIIATADNGAKVNCQVSVDYPLFWFDSTITLSASTELSKP